MMDKSEEYIKMCDFPNIQELWEEGNYKGNNFGIDGIWLPRQDQLQDMTNYKGSLLFGNGIDCLVLHASYGEHKITFKGKSREQLEIQLFMQERYQKKWDGDKWVSDSN